MDLIILATALVMPLTYGFSMLLLLTLESTSDESSPN